MQLRLFCVLGVGVDPIQTPKALRLLVPDKFELDLLVGAREGRDTDRSASTHAAYARICSRTKRHTPEAPAEEAACGVLRLA